MEKEMIENLYPDELAENLYKLASDMDAGDYEENKEEELKDIEDALYQLMAICQNKYNSRYYTTLWNLLQVIGGNYE